MHALFVRAALTHPGVPPQMMSFYIGYPRSHAKMSERSVAPAYLLQQFAWTEPELPRKLAALTAAVGSSSAMYSSVAGAPMFCLETAIKLFFWSVLVYSYTEADPTNIMNVPEAIRELIGGMHAAMRMFNLSKRHLFYDRSCGTKVLVMWNASTIVVAARGSAEAANFLQDAKVCVPGTPRLHACGPLEPCPVLSCLSGPGVAQASQRLPSSFPGFVPSHRAPSIDNPSTEIPLPCCRWSTDTRRIWPTAAQPTAPWLHTQTLQTAAMSTSLQPLRAPLPVPA